MPDIKYISAVKGEVSPHAGSGDHMSHPHCTNTIQRSLCIFSEGNRLALANLLDCNQWHPGKHFSVLSLFREFFKGAHLREDKSCLGRRIFKIISPPL